MLKKLRFTVGLVLILSLFLTSLALAVPGEISYQGKVTDAVGDPIDGTYDMRFRLFSALTGGFELWNPPSGEVQSVLVSDGIYNVSLGAVEPLLEKYFSNDNLYLEVAIYNPISSSWERLAPRQHLTTTAFAFRAADADALSGFEYTDFATDDHNHDSSYVNEGQTNAITTSMIVDATITAADLAANSVGASEIAAGAVGSSEIANYSVTATDLADGAALSEILDDDGPGSGLNADYLDNFSSGSFVQATQDYGRSGVASTLYEGTSSLTSKYVNETGDSMSGSTTGGVLYVVNSHYDGEAVKGVASSTGGGLLYHNYGGYFTSAGGFGRGAYGEATGSAGLGVYGKATGDDGKGVYALSENGDALYAVTDASDEHAGYFNTNVGVGLDGAALYARSFNSSNQGIALWAHNDHDTSTDATAVFSNDGSGPLLKGFGSNGGEDEFRFNNDGTLFLYNGDHTLTVKLDPSESGSIDGSQITLYDSDGNSTIEIDGDYNGDGRITTEELQVTGGSDLSEQFDIYSSGRIEPGMIVSIDPENPGKLRVSEEAYDKKVAGIVSGAGGIKTGMMMGQRGSEADGALPVALTGRVYCRVDTANGVITPGDLLTSSARPGYAMKVSNYQAAQGAIIGKAMTALNKGDGLVLVLVTLQ